MSDNFNLSLEEDEGGLQRARKRASEKQKLSTELETLERTDLQKAGLQHLDGFAIFKEHLQYSFKNNTLTGFAKDWASELYHDYADSIDENPELISPHALKEEYGIESKEPMSKARAEYRKASMEEMEYEERVRDATNNGRGYWAGTTGTIFGVLADPLTWLGPGLVAKAAQGTTKAATFSAKFIRDGVSMSGKASTAIKSFAKFAGQHGDKARKFKIAENSAKAITALSDKIGDINKTIAPKFNLFGVKETAKELTFNVAESVGREAISEDIGKEVDFATEAMFGIGTAVLVGAAKSFISKSAAPQKLELVRKVIDESEDLTPSDKATILIEMSEDQSYGARKKIVQQQFDKVKKAETLDTRELNAWEKTKSFFDSIEELEEVFGSDMVSRTVDNFIDNLLEVVDNPNAPVHELFSHLEGDKLAKRVAAVKKKYGEEIVGNAKALDEVLYITDEKIDDFYQRYANKADVEKELSIKPEKVDVDEWDLDNLEAARSVKTTTATAIDELRKVEEIFDKCFKEG